MKTKPDGTTEALNDNGDLWWSLLGGGGGVYGIVTQFKYKLHDPPDGFVRMSVVFPVEWHKEGCVGIAEQVSCPSKNFNELSVYTGVHCNEPRLVIQKGAHCETKQ